MEQITLEQLEKNFDEILDRAEKGESFYIMTPDKKDVVLVPYKDEIRSVIEDGTVVPYTPEAYGDEELIRLHTDHEEGS